MPFAINVATFPEKINSALHLKSVCLDGSMESINAFNLGLRSTIRLEDKSYSIIQKARIERSEIAIGLPCTCCSRSLVTVLWERRKSPEIVEERSCY